jgi:hypothetical protein
MKKIYFLISAFLIFFLSFSYFSAEIYAQSGSSVASSSSKQKVNIEYELPYPGLLPDSPLYFLRAIRDKLVSLLISDSLKKAEFNLLQADKRLNAGIYLLNKGKDSLALSTVSKAENYFEQALGELKEAKTQGQNISAMQGNLRNALEKHKQELGNLIKKANANFKTSFEKEQERLSIFEERLSN